MNETERNDNRRFNCQVNYYIIDKLWSFCYKSSETLYTELEITANQYTKIRTGQASLSLLETKWNKKNSPLQKVGLPKEIMLGYSMLQIEGIASDDWKNYTEIRWSDKFKDKDKKAYRKNKMRQFDNKLTNAFLELKDDRMAKSNIEKLYYFINHGVAPNVADREMKELYHALGQINTNQIMKCDDKLMDEICKSMKEILYKIEVVMAYKALK